MGRVVAGLAVIFCIDVFPSNFQVIAMAGAYFTMLSGMKAEERKEREYYD